MAVAGCSSRFPLNNCLMISWAAIPWYGLAPKVRISHTVTPKLHTSDLWEYTFCLRLSGAIQRTGTCGGEGNNNCSASDGVHNVDGSGGVHNVDVSGNDNGGNVVVVVVVLIQWWW